MKLSLTCFCVIVGLGISFGLDQDLAGNKIPYVRKYLDNASEAATLFGAPVVFRLPALMICLSEFVQRKCDPNGAVPEAS